MDREYVQAVVDTQAVFQRDRCEVANHACRQSNHYRARWAH